MKIICRLLLIMAVSAGTAHAGSPQKAAGTDIILGISAGYSMYEGYYKNKFTGSYCLGISTIFSNPSQVKYLMGEIEFAFSRYPLPESKKSSLMLLAANAGPLFYYPLHPNVQIYAGASLQGSYFHLHTDRMNRNEKTITPGLLAKAGFFFPIQSGVRARVGAAYTLHYLSRKPLHGLNFTGGLSYNFNPAEREKKAGPPEDPAIRIPLYLKQGERAMQKKDIEEAKVNFNKVLSIDPNNREAQEKMAQIGNAESSYRRAMELAESQQYYDALPLLEAAGKLLIAARSEQEKIRKKLAGEVPVLEKKGIELYEKGDYRGCINIINRLLLLDPNNRIGGIYLPRAMKRQEALERLR